MTNAVVAPRGKSLDIAYFLFLVSGFLIFGLFGFASWIGPDLWMPTALLGLFFLGVALTALTAAAALLVGGIRLFIRPQDWGVALASALTVLFLLGLILAYVFGGISALELVLVQGALPYALATSLLGLSWFLVRRRRWGQSPVPPQPRR